MLRAECWFCVGLGYEAMRCKRNDVHVVPQMAKQGIALLEGDTCDHYDGRQINQFSTCVHSIPRSHPGCIQGVCCCRYFLVFWTGSGSTSLLDMCTASGGGPVGQLGSSVSLACHPSSIRGGGAGCLQSFPLGSSSVRNRRYGAGMTSGSGTHKVT